MWRAGYDIEVIRRSWRWGPAAFQCYLWDGHRILPTIGNGVISTAGNTYQFVAQGETYPHDDQTSPPGRAGGGNNQYPGKGGRAKGKGLPVPQFVETDNGRACERGGFLHDTHMEMNPADRMRAISKGMSEELRHVAHPKMLDDGYMPITDLLNAETLLDFWATQDDVRRIVRGEGKQWKKRFELGAMEHSSEISVRACQGIVPNPESEMTRYRRWKGSEYWRMGRHWHRRRL